MTHDCASHFVNKEFAHLVLCKIRKKFSNLKKVTLMPCCPHHGKTDLDRFFGHVSRWLKDAEGSAKIATPEIMLKGLQDGLLLDHAKWEQKMSKLEEKISAVLKKVNFPKQKSEYKYELDIPKIKSMHGTTWFQDTNEIRCFGSPEHEENARNGILIEPPKRDDKIKREKFVKITKGPKKGQKEKVSLRSWDAERKFPKAKKLNTKFIRNQGENRARLLKKMQDQATLSFLSDSQEDESTI